MKFLIDAQLPRRMAQWFIRAGCDAIHTLDLPGQNHTPDGGVSTEADRESRAVISKDSDFVDSHLLHATPRRLLLVSTGNIGNDELHDLLAPLIPDLVREFQTCRFIELTRSGLILRG